MRKIAVIGGGASGALVCAQLLRHRAGLKSDFEIDLQIEWIGNENPFGLGLAYGTRELAHLLNVPAGDMSAFPSHPTHFLKWLLLRHPEIQPQASSYVPRVYYGEYLRDLVPPAPGFTLRADEAIDIEKTGSQYRISLKAGGEIFADEVVLALGALSSLPGQRAHGSLRPSEIGAIGTDSRVLLIGTGLTMIDTILSLNVAGHSGPVMAISRRGLLPHAHAAFKALSVSPEFKAFLAHPIPRLSRALHIFRAECERAEAAGSDWRAVFKEIRPHTATLWGSLTPRQKRQFFTHLRPYWDSHRHRIAPSIDERLQSFRNQRKLRVEAARILKVRKLALGYQVLLQSRKTLAAFTETFDFLVDCTGFASDLSTLQHALLQSAIRHDLVRVDDPPFGISPNATEHPHLHVIGPLLRASLWETVAIPELRVQAAQIAEKIAGKMAESA